MSVLVVTGPPGAGKTTISRLIASRLESPACVIESDWWWTTIVQGYIEPWKAEGSQQNGAVIRSSAAAAAVMSAEGYATVLDGIVGPGCSAL